MAAPVFAAAASASGPGVPVLSAQDREVLGRHAAVLRMRRRQKIALSSDDGPALYLVQKGALLLDIALPDGRRQILLVYLPGEPCLTHLIPDDPKLALMSAGPAEFLRVRSEALSTIARETPETATALHSLASGLLARTPMHGACIGRLGGEERVTSYLLEMGCRLGAIEGGTASMVMPLSRLDIADYLALNPDTLSRIMSRLRAKGVIGRAARGRLIVKDWNALRALSPLGDVIAPPGARR